MQGKAKGLGGFNSLGPSTGGFFSKTNPLLFSGDKMKNKFQSLESGWL
jgi:hypothetical protein